jgi:2-methylcitrate dehydratase PrpD
VTLHEFAVRADPPAAARGAAARAVLDTVGVTLAGASQPAARIVLSVIESEPGRDPAGRAAA